MSKKEVIIFSDYCDEAYPFEEAKECCKERHLEEYPEDKDWEPSDDEVWNEIYSVTQISWEDIQYDLKEFFNDGSVYILTGTAGLWDGRKKGGAIIRSYKDLSRAWAGMDNVKFTDERGVFNIYGYHHDGTNHWQVRKLTERGLKYLKRHPEWDEDPEELHTKLWGKGYSVNLNYVKKVWG